MSMFARLKFRMKNASRSLVLVVAAAALPLNAVDTVTVTASDPSAAETGADTGIFVFSRSSVQTTPLTVTISRSGTATSGSDFTALPTSVVIPANATSATVTVTPIDDTTKEDPETVILTISPNAAYTVGAPSVATVTIASNEQPTVTISATDATMSEPGTDTGTIRFSRDVSPSTATVVTFAVSGTGTSGSDFTSLGTTATIPSNASSVSLTVTALDDAVVEDAETVIVTVSPSSTYLVGTPSSATLTITDNEVPTVTVTATDATAAETGGDTGTFTVTRSAAFLAPLTVSFSVSGTANSGSDFTSLGTSVVIPANAASATVTVTPSDDATKEDPETVILTISANATYLVGTPSVAAVTIASNEQPTVTISATDATMSEPGTDTGTIRFSRDVSPSTATVVTFAVSGTATSGSDFTSLGTTVTIPSNASNVSLTVTALDDSVAEDAETVIVTITPNLTYAVGIPSAATVTITDNDLQTVTIIATDASSTEGGADTGTFTLDRGQALAAALVVRYTVSGSAVEGTDYANIPTTNLTIPAGSATATIAIISIDDTAIEANETVVITLDNNADYLVGAPSTATVTIASDDKSVVTVSATDASASEPGSNTGTFRFSRDSSPNLALVVNFTVIGTATAGSDFTSIGTSATIASGRTSVDVTLTALNDSVAEDAETVIVTIAVDVAYTVGTPSTATVTIADDDKPTVTVTAADASAAEAGADIGVFTISRGVTLVTPQTVSFTVGGTAATGVDFIAIGTSAVILAGASSVMVTVTPVDDAAVEDPETVILTIASNSSYVIGAPASATIAIVSDDLPTVTVTAGDPMAVEAALDQGSFTLSRGIGQGTALMVMYAVGGTATSGSDYVALSGMAMIPAGAVTVVAPVIPLDDPLFENPETVVVTIMANAAYNVGSPAAATVTISSDDTVPVISAHPVNRTVSPGSSATFSVTASGTGTLSYQWNRSNNGGVSWVPISAANSSSYATPAASAGDNGALFNVTVSNAAGSVPSTNALLTVNDRPTISDVADVTINEDAATAALPFTIMDAETAASALTVTASSSNAVLVAASGLSLGGSGANRTITVTPTANQSGTTAITLMVSDGTWTTVDVFTVTVTAVNDLPTISDIANVTINEDTQTAALAFTIGDVETPLASLVVTATSSNIAVVAPAGLSLGGTGANRTITVNPLANQSGTSLITVTVSDGALSVSDTFTVTVTAVNDTPVISSIANVTIAEDSATAVLAFTVSDVETAAASLAVSATSSNPALVIASGLVLGGTGATRTIQITPIANQYGTASITVMASDGAATGAVSFIVNVTAVNDAPTISDIVDLTIPENSSTPTMNFTVGDVETAVGSLTVTTSSANVGLVPNAGLVLGGSGANRTLRVTPAANSYGSATIFVNVSDGTTTATDSFLLTVTMVTRVPTTLVVSGPSSVNASTQTTYSADTRDQFGAPMVPQPTVQWNCTGGGSIGAGSGVFTAPATPANVTLYATAYGPSGPLVTGSITIAVTRAPPVANFTFTNVSYPLGYSFDASSSTDPRGNSTIVSYSWDFGDGSPIAQGKIVSHTFITGGARTVTLTVTDTAGLSGSILKSLSIPLSQEVYLGNSGTRGNPNIIYSYSYPTYSVAVGRGWVQNGGSAFVPDMGSPSRDIYIAAWTYDAATDNPTSDSMFIISYYASTLQGNYSTRVGRGWLVGDAGGLRLVSDRSIPARYVSLRLYQFAEQHYNLVRHFTQFVYSWSIDSDLPNAAGITLTRGWVDGYVNNQIVTPDYARPPVTIHNGSVPIFEWSGWVQWHLSYSLYVYPAIMSPFAPQVAGPSSKINYAFAQQQAYQYANSLTTFSGAAGVVGTGYLSANGFNIQFQAAPASPASQEVYLGNYGSRGDKNIIYSYSSSTYGVAVGKGWVQKGGLEFAPDMNSPSRDIYIQAWTYDAATDNPTSESQFIVSYYASTLQGNYSCRVGRGWLVGDAGGLRLVSDRSIPARHVSLQLYQFADQYYNLVRHFPQFVHSWSVDYDQPNAAGITLTRGWVDGYVNNQVVTPDYARPPVTIYNGSVQIFDWSRWLQWHSSYGLYVYPAIVSPFAPRIGGPADKINYAFVQSQAYQNANSLTTYSGAGGVVGTGFLSANGFNIQFRTTPP